MERVKRLLYWIKSLLGIRSRAPAHDDIEAC